MVWAKEGFLTLPQVVEHLKVWDPRLQVLFCFLSLAPMGHLCPKGDSVFCTSLAA